MLAIARLVLALIPPPVTMQVADGRRKLLRSSAPFRWDPPRPPLPQHPMASAVSLLEGLTALIHETVRDLATSSEHRVPWAVRLHDAYEQQQREVPAALARLAATAPPHAALLALRRWACSQLAPGYNAMKVSGPATILNRQRPRQAPRAALQPPFYFLTPYCATSTALYC